MHGYIEHVSGQLEEAERQMEEYVKRGGFAVMLT
jgi:hypothetical protein